MSRPLYSRFCTKTGNEEQTQKYTPFCFLLLLEAKTVLWNWWKPWGKNEFGPPPSTIRTRPPASRATKTSHIRRQTTFGVRPGVWSRRLEQSWTCGWVLKLRGKLTKLSILAAREGLKRVFHNSPISPCPLEAKRRTLARKSPHCCLLVSACD